MADLIDAPCRLLNLPAELRNRIYDLVLEDTAPVEVDIFTAKKHMPSFGLISTCRQIRQENLLLHKEALSRFWRSHDFIVKLETTQCHKRDYRLRIMKYCARLPAPRIRYLELQGLANRGPEFLAYQIYSAGFVKHSMCEWQVNRKNTLRVREDLTHDRDSQSLDVRKITGEVMVYFWGVQVLFWGDADKMAKAVNVSARSQKRIGQRLSVLSSIYATLFDYVFGKPDRTATLDLPRPPLLALPPELRNRIYDLIYSDMEQQRKDAPANLDILRAEVYLVTGINATCRQLRAETLHMQRCIRTDFWHTHRFFLDVDRLALYNGDREVAAAYARRLLAKCAAVPRPRIRHLVVHLLAATIKGQRLLFTTMLFKFDGRKIALESCSDARGECASMTQSFERAVVKATVPKGEDYQGRVECYGITEAQAQEVCNQIDQILQSASPKTRHEHTPDDFCDMGSPSSSYYHTGFFDTDLCYVELPQSKGSSYCSIVFAGARITAEQKEKAMAAITQLKGVTKAQIHAPLREELCSTALFPTPRRSTTPHTTNSTCDRSLRSTPVYSRIEKTAPDMATATKPSNTFGM
ncbi:hypothetical protein LTR85_005655 [Meristemomyces frigidus]|nr:hypothetical protein LTR85_005655 [Meristemomyces frigidus]